MVGNTFYSSTFSDSKEKKRVRPYWKQAVCIAAVAALLSVVLVASGDDATTAATACASGVSDVDGDGWGWENGESCEVQVTTNQGGQPLANAELDSTDLDLSRVAPCTATGVDLDADGDGWGWENGKSCKVVASSQAVVQTQSESNRPDAEPTTSKPELPGPSILDLARPAPVADTPAPGDFPLCQQNTSGGFGWENEMSCLAERPLAKPVGFCGVEDWVNAGFFYGRIGGELCQVALAQPVPTESPAPEELAGEISSAIVDLIQNRPELPIPFSQSCTTIESFMAGCNVSVPLTQSYSDYLRTTGVAPADSDVGARVQLQNSTFSIPSTEKVLYVIGPYLGAEDDSSDHDSIAAEIKMVEREAPVLRQIMNRSSDVAVVYIGFGNAPDSHLPVASRVNAAKQVVRSFEAVRAARGSLGESMLIGVSLGGVVGKIGLHELESEGFDHGVDTFVSFDAPHYGAYTPHSLQYIPIFMEGALAWIDDKHFGLLSNRAEREARRTINLTLRSPVAQDLLISNLGYSDHKSPNIDYIRSRYRNLPATTRNVAIASGSIDGSRPTSGPDILTAETGKASSSRAKAKVNFRTLLPSTDQNSVTFSGQMSFKSTFDSSFRIGKRIKYTRTFTVDPSWTRMYDRGACARSDQMVDELRDKMDYALSEVWSNRTVTNDGGAACFIPTFSAIIGNVINGEQIIGPTAFDQVIGDSANKDHLATSKEMDRQILTVVDETFDGTARFVSRRAKAPTGGTVQDLVDSSFDTVVESFDYEDEDGNVVPAEELRAAGIID